MINKSILAIRSLVKVVENHTQKNLIRTDAGVDDNKMYAERIITRLLINSLIFPFYRLELYYLYYLYKLYYLLDKKELPNNNYLL